MSYLRISGYLGLIFLGVFWLTTGAKNIHDEQYFFGTIIILICYLNFLPKKDIFNEDSLIRLWIESKKVELRKKIRGEP
jgi:hypothetical protein